MKLKNIRLTLGNVNTAPNRKDMTVTDVLINRARNEDGSMGKDIQNYVIACAAYKGDILKVKIGIEHAEKFTKLSNALKDDATVLVTFSGLKLRAYAMLGDNGQVISGVGASAEDFEFTVKELDDDFEVEL